MTDHIPPRLCLPGPDVPDCPPLTPSTTLEEDIAEILRGLGLNESSAVDSNTPLNVIRHLSAQQTYGDAIGWASQSTLLAIALFIMLFAVKISTLINRCSGEMVVFSSMRGVMSVYRICLWAVLTIYALSTASVLLNEITPLRVREFLIFAAWAGSVLWLSAKMAALVEAVVLAWGVMSAVVAWLADRARAIGDYFTSLR